MTLSDWIAAEQITMTEASRRFGVAHTTVARWCTGKLFPGRESLIAIRDATDGKVMPGDFTLSVVAAQQEERVA